MSHTPEPWSVPADGNLPLVDADGNILITGGGHDDYGLIACAPTADDARRIVACVNALEGLNDHALAGGWSFKGISSYVNSILEQRKQLLDVADAIDKHLAAAGIDAVPDSDNPIEDLRHRAQAAIAKCRQGGTA